MKTKFLSILAALFAAASFADGFQYLYWMVDISDYEDDPSYAFSYATVSAGGTTFDLYDNTETAIGKKFGNDEPEGLGYTAGIDGAAIYAGDVSAYLSSTFLFELFNEKGKRVAWANVAGSSLVSNGYIGDTMAQITDPYVLSQVIPEPTGGLLLLVGLAGLALKRKRTI